MRISDWSSDVCSSDLPGDEAPSFLSAMTTRAVAPQLSCAITRTTEATHRVIRESLDRSPLYTGMIGARGPRYCPSIEDKIVSFGDRDGHQTFLAPEGAGDRSARRRVGREW